MKITKKQEKIVLNALTDSYLAIENELLSIGKEKYEYIPKSHWKQLRGIKEILEENKEFINETGGESTYTLKGTEWVNVSGVITAQTLQIRVIVTGKQIGRAHV